MLKSDSNIRRIALDGVLIALALILGFVEAQVPTFFAVPGMKLGLTNLVILFALYTMKASDAFFINIMRIIIAGVLFGTGMSVAYSIAGGMLSFFIMLAMIRLKLFKIVTVSIAGGICHNVGQILVACLIMNTYAVAGYFIVLWFAGIVAGAVIGVLCAVLVKRKSYINEYWI